MKSDKIVKYAVTLVCSIVAIAAAFLIHRIVLAEQNDRTIRVGYLYVGDLCDTYTNNFALAQREIEKLYGEHVISVVKYNVPEDAVETALIELINEDCELIFTTSYGYGEKTKEIAGQYPDIQFCQATCSNANTEPVISNYHTFMGNIYEGRYICGVVAGMKLNSLIEAGEITPEQAKIGYIGAFPYAEVISGYTSFFLGVRSVVPEATMTVKYTNSWSNYHLEKTIAEELIREDCVIISQHSDTAGPASACEETERSKSVYYVSYNESMRDIAPTTYLTGSRINWIPYMTKAVEAVLNDKKIESCVSGNINGNDAGSGFENDWIKMLEINDFVVAAGTQERVNSLIDDFRNKRITVFKGDYTGVDPYDPSDTIDLSEGYNENEKSSAPSFHYILNDVITIED
ncbi:MAG: BMP family ABC transporter substrate-binding protein [Oscillospiraceae bacterium]